jgi:4-hydroxy-4-methyl-2-oxoglutarate aldolase
MAGAPAFERTPADQVAKAAEISTATLHEAAGKIGALPSAIKPVAPGHSVSGPVFTVKSAPGDNLWLHRAIAAAQAGDVLVVDVFGHHEAGYWGDIMTTAAQAKGLGGLVIDGCVRDGAGIAAGNFPVFSRGLCIRGTGKDEAGQGFLAEPLPMGDVVVEPGDLVRGDTDGVVVIPRAQVAEAIEKGLARDAKEAEIMEKLRSGEGTMGLYGWR